MLQVALAIYLVALVLMLLVCSIVLKIRFWSALVLSSLIALLLLLAIFPPGEIMKRSISVSLLIYAFAIIATLALLFLYVITRCVVDSPYLH